MTTYRRTDHIVEAEPFREELADEVDEQGRTFIGGIEFHASDYVVTNPDGSIERCGPNEFEDRFQEVVVVDDLDWRVINLLYEAGFHSPEDVQEATDDELLEVDGIGERTLEDIRDWYGLE